MSALLYLDLLGVRAKWLTGGRPGVEGFVDEFRALVSGVVKQLGAADQLRGGLEADSLALVCETTDIALLIARDVYRAAFRAGAQREQSRLWMRGVVTPCGADETLRGDEPIEGLPNVSHYPYGDALLDAIAVERSGVKGMRILITNDLVTESVRSKYRVSVGNLFLIPFRKLHNSSYPPRVSDRYQDYLWMASGDGDADDLLVRMEQRLRWSSRDNEEFLQAAATQVLFHEYKAIRHSVDSRADHAE